VKCHILLFVMKRHNERPGSEPNKHSKSDSWSENLKRILQEEKQDSHSAYNKVKPQSANSAKQNKEEQRAEKDFHLEQSKKRSEIRIEQNRATTFDKLLQVSKILTNEFPFSLSAESEELFRPYTMLDTLQARDLELTKTSIELHLKLEKNLQVVEYWDNLLVICENLLLACESGLKEEIEQLVNKKGLGELDDLKIDILQKIDRNAAIDRNFWNEVLTMIELYKARLKLEKMLREVQIKGAQGELNSLQSNNLKIQGLFFKQSQPRVNFGEGSCSPQYCEEPLEGFELLSEAEDTQKRSERKSKILEHELSLLKSSQSRLSIKSNPLLHFENSLLDLDSMEKIVKTGVSESIEDIMRLELAKKSSGNPDENDFGELVNIKPVMQDWMKKYKPRKPKFFNRIKTGYEWTRYNQTHYDHLNPPPKVVQGYKFNIFYPYLIDKSKAPQFYLQPEESNQTCIIRFHAGPPYEDIAFRIVNREWDFTDRNGFKCFFDKGILHLYFNFKRHRYKR